MSRKIFGIGIDLGTTKCCVGVVCDGKVKILENERSSKTTPSYVAFTDTERLLGEDAKDQATLNPTNTIFGVKRVIGRVLEDSEVTKATSEMPYIIVDNAGDLCINVTYQGGEEMLLPQQVIAMLLTKMDDLIQKHLGYSVNGVVISVPASFSNAQRQATKDAATIAGLKVLALINEPTAAAIAYQANRREKAEETIAVVDFGGGKLDVAIVSVKSACVSVKGFSGTMDLGGNDLDKILMAHIQEKFRERFSQDTPKGITVFERLRAACVKLKNSLSVLPGVQDQLDCFGDKFLLPVSINSAEYEDMILNSIQHCLRTHLDRALQISGMNKQNISRVVLVGGSNRIPLVPKEIKAYFDGCKLDWYVSPEEAVAQGAALYAALLSEDKAVTKLVVEDMLPNSFCFAPQGCSEMKRLFPNCVIIPATNRTIIDEKNVCLKYELYEEFSGRRNPHRLIGTLCVSDVINSVCNETNTASSYNTHAVFEIDRCGIFKVTVQLGPSQRPSWIFRDVVSNYAGRLNAKSLQNALDREQLFRKHKEDKENRVENSTALKSCCLRLQDKIGSTEMLPPIAGRQNRFLQNLAGLFEKIKVKTSETIDWLNTAVNVSKSECETKLEYLTNLECNLIERLYLHERYRLQRVAAKNSLMYYLSSVQTLLTNTDVSEEEEKAAIVREQLDLVDKCFQLGINCAEKQITLTKVVRTLELALEVRRQEKERVASVADLQAYCSELTASVTNKPTVEADLQLVTELCDEAKDTLQWLVSNDELASKEECLKKRNSLEEKIKRLQRRAEKQERDNLEISLENRCRILREKMQSYKIERHDLLVSLNILNGICYSHTQFSKKRYEKELCSLTIMEDEVSELVKACVLQEKVGKKRFEAGIRQEEQAVAAKLQEERAEVDKRQKEQAEADKRQKEQAETNKRQEVQAEADKRQEKQAEADKRQEEQAEADKRQEVQAEADKRQEVSLNQQTT